MIYNWGYNSAYGGEKEQPGNPRFNFTTINMVANYYKPGPATDSGAVRRRIVSPSSRDGASDFGQWYVAENYMYGDPKVTADNWAGGVQPQGGDMHIELLKLAAPWKAMPIRQQTAEEAYRLVLQHAGASLPRRDPIDARIVEEVRMGTAKFGETYGGGGKGIIDRTPTATGCPTHGRAVTGSIPTTSPMAPKTTTATATRTSKNTSTEPTRLCSWTIRSPRTT